MKHVSFTLFLFLITISSFAQFSDTAQLNQYIRDTITDRRPDHITATQLQKALLGVSQFLVNDSDKVPFSDTANMLLPYLLAYLGIKYTDTTSTIATQTMISKYLPLSWSTSQTLTGTGLDTLNLYGAKLVNTIPIYHQKSLLQGAMLYLFDTLNNWTSFIGMIPNQAFPALYMNVGSGTSLTHGLGIYKDSVGLFTDAGATWFMSNGDAQFNGNVTGITPVTSDSSTSFATTQWVKQKSFLITEVDPVALNTNITLNQSRGVLINGAASQKLGASPVWTIGADTTVVGPVSDVVKYLRMQDTRTANPAKLPSGAGTRFDWIPNLAAIRAGSVTGNKWDSANIAPYSVAFGSDNLVTGNYSFSAGASNTIANNVYYSCAIGYNNYVAGYNADAIGGNDTATGGGSLSWGYQNKAIGGYSVAGGQRSYANGYWSTVQGLGLNSNYNNQVFFGRYNDSTNGAILFGLGYGSSLTSRKNIFTVDTGGTATAILFKQQTGDTLATKAYARSVVPSLQTLTLGSGLLGTSYNGSAPVTAQVDSTTYATLFALNDSAAALRAAFGGGISQVYNKYGTIISGGDSISVDTTTANTGLTTLYQNAQKMNLFETRTTNPTIMPSGAGTRMEWIPSLGAFRAGKVTGTAWDSANIGTTSIAFGTDNLASGINSFAAGFQMTVSGNNSVGIGGLGVVSGVVSMAGGQNDTVSGNGSFSWGSYNKVVGNYGFSVGANNIVSSQYGVAVGSQIITPNQFQVYMGRLNDTIGSGSVLFGLGSPYSNFTRRTVFKVDTAGGVIAKTVATSDSSNYLASTAWVARQGFSKGSNNGTLSRIGPIDSLPAVANGLQVSGNAIFAQTASSTKEGMESTAHWLETDSIIHRTLKSVLHLGHPGAGYWSAYPSAAGDTLYSKNLNVSSGLILSPQTDSSLLFQPDFTVLTGLTNTQTLTNKTLTAPLLTNPQLGTTSTSGYVWTATDGSGHGSWQAATGGGGSQTLAQSLTTTTDTLKISGGNNVVVPAYNHSTAGMVTAALGSRLDSIITVKNSGHGYPLLRAPSTMDSLVARGVQVTASNGLAATYTGNKDSVAFNVGISGGILSGANGGTGVNNGSKTITLGGNLTTSGANNLTLTTTGSTNVTLPTSGTLLTTSGSGSGLSGIPTSITGTTNEIIASASTGAVTLSTPQAIGTSSSPTFAGMSLTGLGSSASTDSIVTVNTATGQLRRTTAAVAAGVSSGTYTPTVTSGDGLTTSLSGNLCEWIRIGNIVMLSGSFNYSTATQNGQLQVLLSLPSGLGSNFTALTDVNGTVGTGNFSVTAFGGGFVCGYLAASNTIAAEFFSGNGTICHFNCMYIIR